jgi:hypothetical protein
MTNAAVEATVSYSDVRHTEKEFEWLYSDLNAARAAYFDPNADQSDEAADARGERYFRAERTFMVAAAPRQCWVWMKWGGLGDGRHKGHY